MIRALYGVPAPAKINWFVHVLGRRADGYHELQTVFQFIDWCDRIDFVRRDDGVVERSGGAGLPDDDLCVRAARALQARTGCGLGVSMRLHKSIPAQAGLGGGSSDAASTLLALNRLWRLGLTRAELQALALGLGADVPVFVFGRNAFAGGVGEQLRAVELPAWDVLVGWPGQGLSTAAVFGDAALRRDGAKLDADDFVAAQRAAGSMPALEFGRNDLQPVAMARLPAMAALHAWLAARGHGAPRMSGSGSALFVRAADAVDGSAVPAHWRVRACRALTRHPLCDWADDGAVGARAT